MTKCLSMVIGMEAALGRIRRAFNDAARLGIIEADACCS